MSLPVPDRTFALGETRASIDRLTALLRRASPSRTAIGHWSTAELACHIGQLFQLNVDMLNGGRSPVADHLNLGQAWDPMVADDPERDLGALTERIEKGAQGLFESIEARSWTDTVVWHGGLELPAYAIPCIVINEAEVHGHDIALAEGQPWQILRARANLIIEGLMTLLPAYLDTERAGDLDATFELSLRGGSRTYLRVVDRTLTISLEKPGPVDCHISADPVEYLLIGYGRKTQWGPILQGRVVAWGLKPWLGLRFGKLFHVV